MALVVDSSLPAFATMRAEGVALTTPDETGGLPHLSVGLLNLMPDAALRATDRQFVRLVAAGADRLDISIRPFTVAAEVRGETARAHIEDHYTDFASLQDQGLDALIITGANPARHELEEEAFWDELGEVLDWAGKETRSILCSCLATHVVLQKYRDTKRTRLPEKMWGVYSHDRVADHHLLDGLGDAVEAPHSHWYDVTRAEMESAGLTVLLESEEAGVHMAVDDDDFYVFFQGHPEYDLVSLLKEYRRELGRFYRGETERYPPVPEHYFDVEALAKVEAYRPVLEKAKQGGTQPPGLAEAEVLPRSPHTWSRDGEIIYRNWLTEVARRVTR